ncbi:serine hydrolase domain-containing protein [Tsuneonella sp. HG094]
MPKFAILASAAMAMVAAPALSVEADFAAKAEAIVEAAYPATGPGAAVVVTEHGKVVYSGASGMADIAGGKPITADTVFRIGSLTKQFSAAVVLQLVAEGKLSLDDPVTKFVPGYPGSGGKATVRQLLNHTSGIQSYTGIPGWMAGDKPAIAFTTTALIGEFRDQPVEFQPGEKWNYNNSGYVLVGAVIEAVTGKPWWQAVDDRIVKPLGLTSIRYGGEEETVAAFATGYSAAGEGKYEPSRKIDMSVPHAAGALIGTVGDFARWAHALHHGKVVSPALYAEMIAPTKLADGTSAPYGYGIAQSDVRGLPALTHSGGIFGFGTNSIYLPDSGLAVTVFTNADSGIQSAGMPMLRIAAEAIGKPFPVFAEVATDPAAVAPMLGVYAIEGGESTRLFHLVDGKLHTRRTGASDSPVFAAGGNRFFYGAESLNWFEVVKEGDGYAMLMHQNGAEAAERAVRTGPVPEVATVEVARETLASYAGSYTSALAPVAVAQQTDGSLTLAFGPQPALPLQPLSETEFAIAGVDAKVVFVRDSGATTGLVLHQGGRELPAKKD